MTYIIIFMISFGGQAGGAGTAEFGSKMACEAAITAIEDGMYRRRGTVSAICVPKN